MEVTSDPESLLLAGDDDLGAGLGDAPHGTLGGHPERQLVREVVDPVAQPAPERDGGAGDARQGDAVLPTGRQWLCPGTEPGPHHDVDNREADASRARQDSCVCGHPVATEQQIDHEHGGHDAEDGQ